MNNITSEGNDLCDNVAISKSCQEQDSASSHCSGKGCTKIAKNLLLILYINKTGYFCDGCTSDLLTKQLAVRIQEGS